MSVSTKVLVKNTQKEYIPTRVSWYTEMPGYISREDALGQHPCETLFHEDCPNPECVRRSRCQAHPEKNMRQ